MSSISNSYSWNHHTYIQNPDHVLHPDSSVFDTVVVFVWVSDTVLLLSTLVLFLKSNSYAETGRILKRSVSRVSHVSGQSRQMRQERGGEEETGWGM